MFFFFSVLKLVLKCNLKAGCCFCFASLWEPPMQTAPRRHKERRLRALGRDVCGSICSSHTRRDAEIESSYWTNKDQEPRNTLALAPTHTEKTQKNNADLGLFSWTHFITEKLWINNAFPECVCQRTWQKMERVINMSNMTHVALSALKASVQWKGAWTQHTWRTRTKKKTKKENKSLQGGTEEMCWSRHNQVHSLSYLSSTWGGKREPPCLFGFFYVQVGC